MGSWVEWVGKVGWGGGPVWVEPACHASTGPPWTLGEGAGSRQDRMRSDSSPAAAARRCHCRCLPGGELAEPRRAPFALRSTPLRNVAGAYTA